MNTTTLQNELHAYRSVNDNQTIKVKAGLVRKEVEKHAVTKSSLMAAVAALAYIADNVPISFEERRNIDAIMKGLDGGNPIATVNEMARIAGHYTKS